MALGKSRVSKKRAVDPEQIAEEAVKILWKAIEEAKMYIEDPMLTPEEKRRWAKTMADMIGVFNKLLASRGERQLERENLGTLLTKVPRTFRRTVERRVRMWRERSL